ncbi:MAG: Phosphoglycolate phosphatase [Smithella sp. PtaU1.Bin162]|jgi:phosphoglycolate phosphatase|nr:MAG: Phosphoglycolate phosphatase [Smithella sp. PtaU1.Bin162]
MRLFLFDFDGVLVESLAVYEKVVGNTLARMNMPLTRGREEFLELFEGNFYESLAERKVDVKQFMEASGSLIAAVTYRDMQPITSMLAVVDKLQKNNILLVISSNDSPTIYGALKQFQFNGYFQEVLGSDFLLSKKDKILYAAKKYQIMPEDIYYIGDTTGDIKEGRAAGVKTVGITWGWHSKEKMKQAGPDYLFTRPEELLQLNS